MTLRLLRAATPLALGLTLASSVQAQKSVDYHGRKAWAFESSALRLLVTPGGGHIASVTLKSGPARNINPFWLPPWQSVEPGAWSKDSHFPPAPDASSPLLSSILGHNICVDFFGAPSPAEAKAGLPVHGEAASLNWTAEKTSATSLTYSVTLPKAQMKVKRVIALHPKSPTYWITETVENLTAFDRPFGWQQHPTFGPPFLQEGATVFDMPATKSQVNPAKDNTGMRLKSGAEFEWPMAPQANGEEVDLREWPKGKGSGDYTASIIDPSRQWGYFTVLNKKKNLVAGYVWPRKDWPWVGNWEENRLRAGKPWLKKAITRGMEFGTTPWPNSRRDAITQGSLFGQPTYRWISAQSSQTIGYGAFVANAPAGATGVKDVLVKGKTITVVFEGVEKTLTLSVAR